MNKIDAQADADRRNAESDQPGFWAVQESPEDGWRVVHVAGPGLRHSAPTGAHVESRPRPDEPADPRPSIFQNVPPYGA